MFNGIKICVAQKGVGHAVFASCQVLPMKDGLMRNEVRCKRLRNLQMLAEIQNAIVLFFCPETGFI